MFLPTCACCNADLTCPQFFNGKVYGYTCILKVNPQQKRVKNQVWVKADSVDITWTSETGNNSGFADIVANVGGCKFTQKCALVLGGNTKLIRNGLVCIMDEKGLIQWGGVSKKVVGHDIKGKALWELVHKNCTILAKNY